VKEHAEVDLNDELLCAYMDDELDAVQRERVSAALAADAGAQLRLQRMRDADRDLAAAMPLAGGDHFEAAMTARILGGKPVVSWRRHVLPWASAAAVAGLFVGYLAPRGPAGLQAGEMVQLAPDVQAMLETRAAGEPAADGMTVVLTFETQDSRYCRLFRSTAAVVGEGLACRSGKGSWQLTAWDAAAAESADAFRPAGASAVTDAAMTTLGGQPAFDAQAEALLLQRGWRKP
jgi:anti-sigma factor RsiW